MSAAIPTPRPPEGSWMLRPERKAAWDYLHEAMECKRSRPPADAYDEYTQGAPVTHTAILRSLEQVYLTQLSLEHAPSVKDADLADFLGFVEAITFSVADHHRLEEDFIFPRVNALTQTTIWQPVSDEHERFIPPVFALWHYVRHCRTLLGVPQPSDIAEPWVSLDAIPTGVRNCLDFTSESEWDGAAVQRHMETFMLGFAQHIPFEAESSVAANLRKATAEDIGKLLGDLKKESFKTMNLHVQLPLVWTHNEMSDVKHFVVERPWLNRGLTWWFGGRHATWWKFSAYPQNLA